MVLDESINETIKAELLRKLGSPTHYYQAWVGDNGWYLEETKIETIDLEKRFSSGYNIKINNHYVTESYYLFDKEKAQEYVDKQNVEFFNKEIKRCKEYLDTIDEKIIKEKANARARIEIAEKRLAKLEGKQ